MDMTVIREAVNLQVPILLTLAGLSLLGLLAIIAMFVSLTIRSGFEGLEGIWYKTSDPNYSYQFLPSGKVVIRNQGREIRDSCTWNRFDNIVEVCDRRSEGAWSFTGEVKGNEIQGQFVGYDELGCTIYSLQDEWRRVPPINV